ncbi:hypothetical protein [Streptosporangium sp. OZ121]
MKIVGAFIVGCGSSEDDLAQWATAWRLIRLAKTRGNVTSLFANRCTAS